MSSAQQMRTQKSAFSTGIEQSDTLRQVQYQVYARQEYRTAESFFDNEKESFGWVNPAEELVLLKDDQKSHSRHVTYQQSFKGLPVLDQRVHVNFDRFGRVSMVVSSFEPVRMKLNEFNTSPSISSELAAKIAFQKLAFERGRVSQAKLGVYNLERPSLVWEVFVWPEHEPAEYRVFVDAKTGEIVKAVNQAIAFRPGHTASEPESNRIDGSGMVYDPGPLHFAGVLYGPPYVDADNADNPQLNAARKAVMLNDISLNNAGRYQLVGPYVTISGVNQGGSNVYTPPTELSPDGFQYTRNQSGFEAVNAYYHIDKSQRYVQSLGIADRLNVSLRVNPQGLSSDDSFYFPNAPPIVVFGTGGVDDAEDPSVILHEYAHALLDAVSPGLLGTGEGQAFHEGWADYWASSYQRSLVESGGSARTDWRKLFAWDSGDGSIWAGRTVSSNGIYPQDVCTTRGGACNIYTDGLVWASTMMEVYDQLGRAKTDQLSLLSHAYLSFPLKFSDAAQAVIQADLDYNQGFNTPVLIDVFSRRGLVDGSQFAPIVSHTPLVDTEAVASAIEVEVNALGISAPLATVQLFTESVSKGVESFLMTEGVDHRFVASIVLPASLDSVFYYFKVEDTGGRITFLPETAPASRFRFTVGEDLHAPTIDHIPITEAGFVQWPLKLEAKVTDNFSVASVKADFILFSADGQEVYSGSEIFSSQAGMFTAYIKIPLGTIKNGQSLHYAIEARDGSAKGNTRRSPESGYYEAFITAEGDLRIMSFESTDPVLWSKNGQWEVGSPTYGRKFAQKGSAVFGTNLDGAYVSNGSQSVLEFETINLLGVSASQLSFWHFYDTESEKNVDPGSTSGNIYDGGVVQYRASQSSEWLVLEPLGGYPGQFESGSSNPLVGMPAFGGYSFGWRKERFVLPQIDGLQIRLVFATNATNSHFSRGFAGWLVDDVLITSTLTLDDTAPTISEHPGPNSVASVDDPVRFEEIVASDNDGIQEVVMHWSLQSGTNILSGIDRLGQDEFESDRFGIYLDMASSAKPGDRLSYYLEVRDPSGNNTRFPEGGSQHEIVFRIRNVVNPTTEIWLTGDWREETIGWMAVGNAQNKVSTLNLKPIVLPSNAVLAELQLIHSFQFSTHMAGQVEVSTDKGNSWNLLDPISGYSGTVLVGTVPDMAGEKAFLGSSRGQVSTRFSLTEFVGKQVFIRIAAATSTSSTEAQSWQIEQINLKNEAETDQFEVENRFELLPVYPNPFVARTNVSFSLKEAADVEISLYDMLGREVALLFAGRKGEGSHSLVLERNNLVSGVYLLKLQAGNTLKTQKVIVSR